METYTHIYKQDEREEERNRERKREHVYELKRKEKKRKDIRLLTPSNNRPPLIKSVSSHVVLLIKELISCL